MSVVLNARGYDQIIYVVGLLNFGLRFCTADLASGGCISAFKWNGGADYKGKAWNESLLTDSAVCSLCCMSCCVNEEPILSFKNDRH